MTFTDTFIKRPVLASVISLLILVLGFVSFYTLQLRQFPKLESTVITVTTTYPGATAKLIQGYVTTPLSQAIGSADGIDYMTATSTPGLSTITVYVKVNYSADEALTNISSKINSVLFKLPPGATNPSINSQTGDAFPVLFVSFTSDTMSANQITAYLKNVVSPKLYNLGGISTLNVWGGQDYAMRIWLDPKRMATLGVTADEVQNALLTSNVQSAAGQLEGQYDYIDISAETDVSSVEQFQQLVVKRTDDSVIRIRDIANVELGSKAYTQSVTFNGQPGVFLAISTTPNANPLTVVSNVLAALPNLQKNFPQGLNYAIAYDGTVYINESIKEVMTTVLEAVVIVTIVIFLFLGSFRSVLIPVVTIPLSMIGVCFLMLMLGFSLNLLTLLAMVLAIGLVVDDAIVVLENIHRHMEDGKSAFESALLGARQIATPVIVMTLTLAAVFAPIGFIGGVTGALFKEFAFTLAASVIISGIIALTFSPMMCSRLLNESVLTSKFAHRVDELFAKLQNNYYRALEATLAARVAVLVLALTLFACCYIFFMNIPSELAPAEDQGGVKIAASGPSYSNLDYLQKFNVPFTKVIKAIPEVASYGFVNGFPASYTSLAIINFSPWSERTRSQAAIQSELQKNINKIPGLDSKVVAAPSLPGTPLGPPINFALTSSGSYEALLDGANSIIQQARNSGMFAFITTNLAFNKPQLNVTINRAKAADLGISMQSIGNALSIVYGDGFVNYFNKLGYSFQVIPQALRKERVAISDLERIPLKTASGKLISLGTIADFAYSTQPSQLDQFQQLNSALIIGAPAPGVTMGDALTYLQTTADAVLPTDITYDFGGAARQYVTEGSTLVYAFALAIIVIFLLLAAQFESFRDPLIIMFSVPMSIFGALVPLYLGMGTMNIYTEIGLVTLIGLITKHGILMVEFANELERDEDLPVHKAILKAASVRLRPILMTTAAMVFGVIPLVMASGAGAVSRNDIGIVIASGMTIGTLFTLFVVPTMYTFLHKAK